MGLFEIHLFEIHCVTVKFARGLRGWVVGDCLEFCYPHYIGRLYSSKFFFCSEAGRPIESIPLAPLRQMLRPQRTGFFLLLLCISVWGYGIFDSEFIYGLHVSVIVPLNCFRVSSYFRESRCP